MFMGIGISPCINIGGGESGGGIPATAVYDSTGTFPFYDSTGTYFWSFS
jgi:hypothetical protein